MQWGVTYLTHTHARMYASGQSRGMMGRVFFISDWAVPTHSQRKHTATVGGVSICSPDSLPVKMMHNPLAGARPKSINGDSVMNGCCCQCKLVVTPVKTLFVIYVELCV